MRGLIGTERSIPVRGRTGIAIGGDPGGGASGGGRTNSGAWAIKRRRVEVSLRRYQKVTPKTPNGWTPSSPSPIDPAALRSHLNDALEPLVSAASDRDPLPA